MINERFLGRGCQVELQFASKLNVDSIQAAQSLIEEINHG